MTNDGFTRFHPNMYKNGKMCLSVLNTWRGDQWTGCQSIRTILLTIISIMDNYPLLHEPGFTMKHQDVEKYNKIILYRNIDYCITDIINNIDNKTNIYNNLFKDNIISEFKKKQSEVLSILEKNVSSAAQVLKRRHSIGICLKRMVKVRCCMSNQKKILFR